MKNQSHSLSDSIGSKSHESIECKDIADSKESEIGESKVHEETITEEKWHSKPVPIEPAPESNMGIEYDFILVLPLFLLLKYLLLFFFADSVFDFGFFLCIFFLKA